MQTFHYTLGLDIGIASVGWAVLQNDSDGEPIKIQNLGVRIFEKAEHPKTGESLAAPRREARSARRRLHRHRHRLQRIRWLLEKQGIMPEQDILELYQRGAFSISPYELRCEALERPLSKEEAVRVLIHLAQRRGYQSNSTAEAAKEEQETGKIKAAITENRRIMDEKGYRTVGEMLWKDERCWQKNPDGTKFHQPRNKADSYRFTVRRSDVVEEVHSIFRRQRELGVTWMTEELEEAYLSILESQRSFDEGPGGDSVYKVDFNKRIGICPFEKSEHRAAKATYTFEYFKLLQDINHIRLVESGQPSRPLCPDQRESLRRLAFRSASVSFQQMRKELNLADTVTFNCLYYGEDGVAKAEKRKWPQMQSYHKIRLALDKVAKDAILTLSTAQLDEIGRILTLYKNDERRLQALHSAGIPEVYHASLLPLSFSKFGKLSLTAMKKLIPFLEQGKRYDEACAEAGIVRRDTSSVQKGAKLSIDDLEEITNPVVRRAVSQTIKVINAVVRTYGTPDAVHIELAREMSRSFADRQKLQKRQDENRKQNERLKEQIMEVKRSTAGGLDIVKFKLFQEQDGICMYSGKNLDISRLYEPGYVDVDHIIPYSRCFDDSYQNKVLVLASENRQKGNRLPYEYFGQDAQRWHSFEVRVETKIRNYRKRQKLLKRQFTEEESQTFTARNLQDTQYITTVIFHLIKDHLEFTQVRPASRQVQAVNGAITAMLRGRWGIQKIREDGDLHHCLDAAVVACTSPGMIQRLTAYNKYRESPINGQYLDHSTGELLTKKEYDEKYAPKFPEPWPRFRQELEARMEPADPRGAIDRLKLSTYDSDEPINPIFVSRMPNHKVTGAAHAETIRSSALGDGYTVSKVPLTRLNLDKNGEIPDYYNPASDRLLYDALVERLKAFGGKGEQAFAEPFYKPKADGTPGPLVKKVKVYDKSTLNLSVRNGVADNGDMVRVDVFYVPGDGYYLVPIYVADTQKAVLPNCAVVAHKKYALWKEMDDSDFLFSLYPGDLIRIQSKKGITLNISKGGTGEAKILRKDALFYYCGTDIGSGNISIETHDRQYSQPGLGFKTLLLVEKYQVDVLGNYYKVTSPEKRMPFSKEG